METSSPKCVEKAASSHSNVASYYDFPFSAVHNRTPAQCYKRTFAENFIPNTLSSLRRKVFMSTSTLSMRHQRISCLHARCSRRGTSLVPCRTPQPFLSTWSRNTQTRRAGLFLYSTRSKPTHKSLQNFLSKRQNCCGFATKLLMCYQRINEPR